MIWKLFFVTFLVAGVCASYDTVHDHGCTASAYGNQLEIVQDTFKNFADCAKGLFNPGTIYKDIEVAKPRGALAVVFKKYCDKSTQLKSCINAKATAAVSNPHEKLRSEISSADKIVGQVIDFLCYNYGERLSVFIEDDGPRCFLEQSNPMINCFNQVQKNVPDFQAAVNLSKEEQCLKFGEITSCVIGELRKCSTSTPSFMAETLFSSIYNDSQCQDQQF